MEKKVGWLAIIVGLGLLTATHISAQTLFYLTGNPGYIAQGVAQTDSSANGWTITGSANYQNGPEFAINGPGYPESDIYFTLDFASKSETPLQPGLYTNATRFPFNVAGLPQADWTNGLDIDGEGRGDNELTGEFIVLQAVYSSGTLISFAADFIQNDENNASNQDYGSIRYNSSIPLDIETGHSFTLVPEPSASQLFFFAILLFGAMCFLRRIKN